MKLRVLILEDVDTDAELTMHELRMGKVDAVFRCVKTRESFLMEAFEFLPDVILADYNLPNFTGMDAFRLLQQRGMDVPFIIVTGALSEEVAVECMKEGIGDYILKSSLKRLPAAVISAHEKWAFKRDREKALASLRESEERYRRITETITDYIYTVHVENGTTARTVHSPSCIAVTGFSSGEFAADPYLWWKMVAEEDRPAVMEFARSLESGEVVPAIEHRIVRKDGVVRWVRNTPVMNYDSQGNLLSYDGLIQDITERKVAEKMLKEEMNVTSNLLTIAEATSHTTDADKLMEHVVASNCRIMEADICLTYRWDRGPRIFRPDREFGLPQGSISLFATELLDRKAEFVKRALDENEPVIIEEFQKTREEAVFSWLSDVHTVIVTPLTGKRRNLGLLVSAYKLPRKFNEWDKRIMRGIASQVSIALDQANLYSEYMDRAIDLSRKIETIQVMYEVGKSLLSTLEPQVILETSVRMVSRIASCDGSAVILVDNDKKGFIYKAGYGLPYVTEGVIIPFTDTLATEVVETGMAQYIANLNEMKDLPPLEDGLLREGFLSHIRMPLVTKNEVIGILTVESRRGVAFSSGDMSTLEKLASQIGVALQNAKQISDLEELMVGTVKSLSSAMDAKSHWTAGHSERVTKYALDIAEKIGFSEREMKDLELAALLHDIGKIGTYEAILDKKDLLTKEETAIIRQHPGKGIDILAPVRKLKSMIPAIKHHHEHYNGLGYPNGLKGEEIPLSARILAVADALDAMSSDRPYRKGMPMDAIIVELKKCSGSQFDLKVVKAFLKTVKKE